MTTPIRQDFELDLSRARRALDEFEAQIDAAFAPIRLPVQIESAQAIAGFREDLARLNQQVRVGIDTAGFATAEERIGATDRQVDQVNRDLLTTSARAAGAGRSLADAGARGVTGMDALRLSLVRLAGIVGTGFAVRKIVDFANTSIQAASDLNESMSKADVVFGQFSDTVFNFTSNAPQGLGLSTQAAIETASTFGNLFVSLGLAQQQAADMSPTMVQLGADLASFNNISVDDALTALRSGLVGEIEPLRRLGVSFNAVQVAQEAVREGLATSVGSVSEVAKVQARYNLILRQTTTAQGDFARTSTGIANTQRTLAAEYTDLQAKIGDALVPAYRALLDLAPQVLDAIQGQIPVFISLADAMASVVEHGGGVITFFASLPSGFGALGDVATGLAGIVGGPIKALLDFTSGASPRQLVSDFQSIGNSALDMYHNLETRAVFSSFVDDMSSGVDASLAFDNAIASLAQKGILTADSMNRLARAAGLTDVQLEENIRFLLDNGTQAGLTAADVDLLNRRYKELDTSQARAEQARFNRALEGAQAVIDPITGKSREYAVSLQDIRDAAAAAGQPLAAFAASSDETAQAMIDALDPAQRLRFQIELIGSDSKVASQVIKDNLAGAITDLSGAFDGAVEPTKISAKEFLKNLQDTARQAATFETNVAKLAAAGFTALASDLLAEGPKAATAAADLVKHLDLAGQAEDVLRGQSPGIASAVEATFGDVTQLVNLGPQGLQFMESLASQMESPAARALLEQAILNAVTGVQLQAINIPVSFSVIGSRQVLNVPTADVAQRAATAAGGGGAGVNVDVTINNPTTQNLTQDAETAGSIIGSIGAGLVRAQ